MAIATITLNKLKGDSAFSDAITTATMFTALDAADGGKISFDVKDEKTLLLIQNSATTAKTVTIKKGDGLQAVVDYAEEIPASSTKAVCIESGKFKNISGENKGNVFLTGPADIKVAVFVLP